MALLGWRIIMRITPATRIACLSLATLLSVWGLAPVVAQEQGPVTQTEADAAPTPPVVLELFTSQGCAFCPPADALMGQLAAQDGVIGLSCHVDYFNVRENSLGRDFCTKRQGVYNRVIGTGPRYTPQLIINGHIDMIGYETGKISEAILKARTEDIVPVSILSNGGDAYTLSLPETDIGTAQVRLWYAVYDAPRTLAMTDGGNASKTIQYFNVVSLFKDIGLWDGKALTKAIDVIHSKESAGIAVIAQNDVTGHIVAAGSLKRAEPSPIAVAQ